MSSGRLFSSMGNRDFKLPNVNTHVMRLTRHPGNGDLEIAGGLKDPKNGHGHMAEIKDTAKRAGMAALVRGLVVNGCLSPDNTV